MNALSKEEDVEVKLSQNEKTRNHFSMSFICLFTLKFSFGTSAHIIVQGEIASVGALLQYSSRALHCEKGPRTEHSTRSLFIYSSSSIWAFTFSPRKTLELV
jgi:heme O synthase-like polyprenyltransferase